jgi:hypothetical protein
MNVSADRKSVMKYVKVLMENEILYCVTVRRRDKNYYGRWIHKGEVRIFVEQNEEGYIKELIEGFIGE